MKKKITGIMLLAVLFSAVSVQAEDNLKFKGNLIIPNCTINNGNPVETDWGNVEIQTLGNPNAPSHEKELSISVKCPYALGTPKMKLSGAVYTTAGKTGLQTSKHDEGLLIYLRTKTAGSWVSYNTERNIPANSISGTGIDKTLTMYASLGYYKRMEDLKPGPFTAGATLEMKYE
ncbi:fimbrial protein [Escherichia coli]|uniref:fimbrial protein n=1 Tax=Escherichia coli TaxID=562 RepID=UPI0016508AA7|nr:fimbrial protein [Escherichia coli]MEC9707819.1 fimbrial protein [Escherichia marmotae]ELB8003556.1 fimbrial protein [Escherichia coli]MCF7245339.1 fimbrial protein [Escherichia coli]MCX1297782.1 fimbrial protein [Escherichia coli]MEC9816030.1 fimbrial protein [Escherichia coli]